MICGTVSNYCKQWEEKAAKTGERGQKPRRAGVKTCHQFDPGISEGAQVQNQPNSTLGNLIVTEIAERVYGNPRPRSECEGQAGLNREKLELGLTAQRIYQDLIIEVAFAGSYQSVKRIIRRLESFSPEPIHRSEVQPAEEAQVDFGSGAPVIGEDGRRRRPWIFRIVLSHSRRVIAKRFGIIRTPKRSFVAWRMLSAISVDFPRL